jgi:hypothetical protein
MQKKVLYCIVILGAVILDTLFGSRKLPILTVVVCGIVIIYEFISPHLYTKR